jgi:hypothetical protein
LYKFFSISLLLKKEAKKMFQDIEELIKDPIVKEYIIALNKTVETYQDEIKILKMKNEKILNILENINLKFFYEEGNTVIEKIELCFDETVLDRITRYDFDLAGLF